MVLRSWILAVRRSPDPCIIAAGAHASGARIVMNMPNAPRYSRMELMADNRRNSLVHGPDSVGVGQGTFLHRHHASLIHWRGQVRCSKTTNIFFGTPRLSILHSDTCRGGPPRVDQDAAFDQKYVTTKNPRQSRYSTTRTCDSKYSGQCPM